MPMEKLPDGTALLSGGNPQIAKGDGREPVQAYLDAMPGWKGEIGRHLDALILDAVPAAPHALSEGAMVAAWVRRLQLALEPRLAGHEAA